MDVKTKDEKTIKRYLLGQVSPEEQEEFELWLMSNEDAYDLVVAAEDDLIDDSLAGQLKTDELERFNAYFLVAPERKRKLEFSRSLKRHVGEINSSRMQRAERKPESDSVWAALLELFKFHPKFSFAASASIVLLTAGGIFPVVRMVHLQQNLDTRIAEMSEVNGQRDAIQSQLRNSLAENEKLHDDLHTIANADISKADSGQITVLDLKPGSFRGPDGAPVHVEIRSDTQLVRFRLPLPADSPDHYVVTLLDDGKKALRPSFPLAAKITPNGKILLLSEFGASLPTGDLSLRVDAVSGSSSTEPITFSFRVQR